MDEHQHLLDVPVWSVVGCATRYISVVNGKLKIGTHPAVNGARHWFNDTHEQILHRLQTGKYKLTPPKNVLFDPETLTQVEVE